MTPDAETVVLLDCGTARWKVSVWRLSETPVEVDSFSVEVAGGQGDDIIRAATAVKTRVADRPVTWYLVGTHAIRTIPEYPDLLKELFGVTPRVLTTVEEANLIRHAVLALGTTRPNSAVIDVGGGSVQFISLASDWSFSLPIGTFTLERRYSMSWRSTPQEHLLGAFRLAIDVAKLVPSVQATSITVGSNQMASFFASFSSYCNLRTTGVYSLSDCITLYGHAVRLDTKDYAEAFPILPQFMYGSANCLAVVIVSAMVLGATAIEPTDLGLNAALMLELVESRPAASDSL